jgi:hypothetical protein
MSNLGRDRIFSPLVGSDGTVAVEGCRWYRSSISHSSVALVICSDQPFSLIHKRQLDGLTRADWVETERWSAIHWRAVRPADCLVS